ncbi:MAG TPA: hypothetical protein VLH94_02890, partial [Spirochaetia bacterium]|nr:hypothetical protein [Spirochaetia bacterium]
TTNEMAPMGQFPLQPDKCVTDYAKINIGEDIAESMVAYIYRPKYLKKISPEKYEMLSKHDAKHEKPMVQVRRVPKTEIALPKVETQTVSYYVQEPQEN